MALFSNRRFYPLRPEPSRAAAIAAVRGLLDPCSRLFAYFLFIFPTL